MMDRRGRGRGGGEWEILKRTNHEPEPRMVGCITTHYAVMMVRRITSEQTVLVCPGNLEGLLQLVVCVLVEDLPHSMLKEAGASCGAGK